jgi:CRISPR-associated protein Cmr4
VFYKINALMKCKDPLHVGCGSYAIGKVDLPVIREPGTHLPYIPGSAISGVTRSVMTLRENQQSDRKKKCYPGTGALANYEHCRLPYCPVCTIYGYSDRGKTFQKGCCIFSDAQLVFYPVYENRRGPIMVTTDLLAEKLKLLTGGAHIEKENEIILSEWNSLQGKNIELDSDLKAAMGNLRQTYLVSERDFSLLVNTGIDVRTSISIDYQTGTSMEKALFNYEAVPREAYFMMELTIMDPRLDNKCAPAVSELVCKLEDALSDLSWYGIGGMNTRGLGRLDKVLFASKGGT